MTRVYAYDGNALADDLEAFCTLLRRWPNDPTGVCRKAVDSADAAFAQATRLIADVEHLSQAKRAAGHFSASYSEVRP